MRPLQLRLSGFRSYRAERTIPFADLELVAIIGATGAGKSSLLEAMTWALYGASTWSQRASKELLAHGARRMSVALDFEAAGESWRVTRTYAANGTGSAEIVCLSNADIAKVDNVRAVNPRVVEVVGLGYDVFCSCVLLPQGKFERLLKATKADRTELLKSILRLDALGDARALAAQQADLLAAREREILEARLRFLPDPAGDEAQAGARLTALEPEAEQLAGLRDRIAALDALERNSQDGAHTADRLAAALDARRRPWAEELDALAQRADALNATLATAQAEAAEASTAFEAADAALAEARARREDAETLADHASRIDVAAETLRRHANLSARLHDDERAVAKADAARASADATAELATTALAEHDRQADVTRVRVAEVTERYEALDGATAALRAASAVVAALETGATAVAGRMTEAAETQAAAEQAVVTATGQVDAVLAMREAVRREQAAAHVAAGCAPGDPCPVCARTLPGGFAPSIAADLADADAAVRAAENELETARHADRQASIALSAAQGDAERDAAALVTAQDDRERALTGAVALSEHDGDADAVAAHLERQVAAAAAEDAVVRAALQGLIDARPGLEERCRATAADAATAAAAHVAAVESQAEHVADGHEAHERLAQSVEALPAFCALPAADRVADGDLAVARAAIAERRSAADARTAAREVASATRAERLAAVAAAELALAEEVRTPLAAARAGLDGVVAELAQEDRDALGATVDDGDVRTLAAHARDVETRVEARIAAHRAAAEVAHTAAAQAADDRSELLIDAGLADHEALTARDDDVRAEVLAARRDRDRAAAQRPDAERLDALRARAGELREGFAALKDALLDGAFVGFVVGRRQRALLQHASKVLHDITGRYAFTEDFLVLDRESGLPRSPDTLSGGETFIAALALALGLVEVADRSGGDLRALFLDEGFGTLDATVLDTALTALEERAKAGRLIGVISHVPTVAERIETVLEVASAVDGSTVERLTPAEREQRLDDDAADLALTTER